jgi:hypothetical protein
MKHVWSIACMNSITDERTKSISLMENLEELQVKIDDDKYDKMAGVKIPINFEIIHFLTRDEGKEKETGQIIIDFISPLNKKVNRTPLIQEIEIKKPYKRIRAIFYIHGIALKMEGRYYFRIKLKTENEKEFKQIANLPIDIIFVKNKNLHDVKNSSAVV